jgi:hypothetical protein
MEHKLFVALGGTGKQISAVRLSVTERPQRKVQRNSGRVALGDSARHGPAAPGGNLQANRLWT